MKLLVTDCVNGSELPMLNNDNSADQNANK